MHISRRKKEILIYECTFWNNGNFEFSFMKGQSFKIYCINKKVYWHCCSVVSFDYTYPVYYILKLRTIENYNLFLTSSAAISFSLRLPRSTFHIYIYRGLLRSCIEIFYLFDTLYLRSILILIIS